MRRHVWEEFKSFTKREWQQRRARHAIIDEHLTARACGRPAGHHRDHRRRLRYARLPVMRRRSGSSSMSRRFSLTRKAVCRLPSAPNPATPHRHRIRPRSRSPTSSPRSRPPSSVHIIVEGVLMYLTREQRLALLRARSRRASRITRLYCDLMRKRFFDERSPRRSREDRRSGRDVHRHGGVPGAALHG